MQHLKQYPVHLNKNKQKSGAIFSNPALTPRIPRGLGMKEFLFKLIIFIFIIFSSLFMSKSYCMETVRLAYFFKLGDPAGEMTVARCNIVRKGNNFTIIDVSGNKNISGYYIIYSKINEKRGKKVKCLSDGKYIEVLKSEKNK